MVRLLNTLPRSRPFDLSGRGLSYGLSLPPEAQQSLAPPQTQPEPWNEQPAFNGRGFALSEALQSTPEVQGNSLVEALGAAVTGGLAGRNARNEREMELALLGEDRQRASEDRDREAEQRRLDNEHRQAVLAQDQGQFDARMAQDASQFEQQLALTRRGQDMTHQRSMIDASRPPELSSRDAIRVGEASDAARQSRQIEGLVSEFLALNARVPTGQLSHLRPDQWMNPNRERMRAITDTLTPMLRQPGSGSASDRDMQLYQNALTRVGVTGPANQASGNAMIQMARNTQDYASYLDMYSAGGDLQGAEQNWQIYLNANPIFDKYGNVRTDRPRFEAWLSAGQPDMSGAIASSSAGAAASDEEIMEALQRGRGGREDIDELSRRSMEEHRNRRRPPPQPPARLSGVERGL